MFFICYIVRCTSKDVRSRMGVDLVAVPHQLEKKKKTSASKNVGPQRGVNCEISHRLGRRTTPFIKVWKHLTSRRVLKTLRGNLKGKAEKGQYLLLDWDRYPMWITVLNLINLNIINIKIGFHVNLDIINIKPSAA